MGADIAIRFRATLVLPFVILAAVGILRLMDGPASDFLGLLAVVPAVAAGIGAVLYTLAAGVAAIGESLAFTFTQPSADRHGHAQVMILALVGVTAAGVSASRGRRRRDRELDEIRLVAEAAQRALLRPVPRQAGPVRLAARYLSASSGARVGGDLYEVVNTPDCVRLILGDVQGKGLPAIASAAAVLGVFREAAYEESSLAAIAARLETSLGRQLSEEQFVTAILAEVSADGDKIELLSCGHPAPLLIGPGQPRFIGADQGSLPLGLNHLAEAPRVSLAVPLEPGDEVLFYTDGVSEARNRAGEFFSLADCASLRSPTDPATLVDRLSDEVIRHVGHAPDDDMAMLLAYRDAGLRLAGLAGLAGDRDEAACSGPAGIQQEPADLGEADGRACRDGVLHVKCALLAGGDDRRRAVELVGHWTRR